MPTPRDYYDEILDMRCAQSGDMREAIWRSIGAAFYSMLFSWATQDWWILPWGVAYIAMFWAFARGYGLLRRPLGFGWYIAVYLSYMALTLWLIGLALYFLATEKVHFFFISGTIICGIGLHNIVRHGKPNIAAISDMVIVLACMLLSAVIFATMSPTRVEAIAIGCSGLTLTMYYAYAFSVTMHTRRQLETSMQREIQAQKMQSIGQLTAGIAHDFNNILTVIQGNLELHDALDDPKERQKALKEAREASQKAAHLVAQLLAFSRKSPMTPKPLLVADVVAEFISMAQPVLPANVKLQMADIDDDLHVYADGALLQSAMLNIALNARDAMLPDGGTVLIEGTQVSPLTNMTHSAITITLTDSGPGVDPAILPRLSEPFYTSKEVGEGSGLGLSMVLGFVEQSGGQLEIENAPGAGLRLRMTLPEAIVPLEDTTDQDTQEAAE